MSPFGDYTMITSSKSDSSVLPYVITSLSSYNLYTLILSSLPTYLSNSNTSFSYCFLFRQASKADFCTRIPYDDSNFDNLILGLSSVISYIISIFYLSSLLFPILITLFSKVDNFQNYRCQYSLLMTLPATI